MVASAGKLQGKLGETPSCCKAFLSVPGDGAMEGLCIELTVAGFREKEVP